jgi:serine protease AprX
LIENRPEVELELQQQKIVAAHYQHVDGTSFAAPIVTSIVAQMIQANHALTPGAIKNILISTADRIVTEPVIRQGYGVVNARRAVELAKTERHALNVVGCKPPRVENGRLLFVFHDDDAENVSVAGDFNGWNHVATPLKRNNSGLWTTEVSVPQTGRLEYKFIINGQRWLEDPSNGLKTPDNFGGLNSVLVIE